jgi:hypothetical protein
MPPRETERLQQVGGSYKHHVYSIDRADCLQVVQCWQVLQLKTDQGFAICLHNELRLAQTEAILSGTRTYCQPPLTQRVKFHRSLNRRRLFESHALYRAFHFEDNNVSLSASVGGGGKDSFCCIFDCGA